MQILTPERVQKEMGTMTDIFFSIFSYSYDGNSHMLRGGLYEDLLKLAGSDISDRIRAAQTPGEKIPSISNANPIPMPQQHKTIP